MFDAFQSDSGSSAEGTPCNSVQKQPQNKD